MSTGGSRDITELTASKETSFNASVWAANGADTVGLFDVNWTVEDNGAYATLTIVTVGPGRRSGTAGGPMPILSGEVHDTFTYTVAN